MYRISVLVAVTAILAGCGGSSAPRVLRLRNGDHTEAEVRAAYRSVFTGSSDEIDAYCRSLTELSPAEVITAVGRSETPAVQEANIADDLRAAEILQEECARVIH